MIFDFSDRGVMRCMVQQALDAVEAREGPNFPGWSRTHHDVTRATICHGCLGVKS